jgi:hypothetical protein
MLRRIGQLGGTSAILILAFTSILGMMSVSAQERTRMDDYLIQETPDSGRIGWLKIKLNQPAGGVWIDSLEIFPWQHQFIAVEEGMHIIRVAAPIPAAWFLRDLVDTLFVSGQDTVDYEARLPHLMMIGSVPYGACVFVEGRYLGNTPLYMLADSLTGREIRLWKKGYCDTTVSVPQRGPYTPMILELRPDKTARERMAQQRAEKRRNVLRHQRLAGGAFVVALASGVSALFCKKTANRYYERYRRAGHPQQMNEYFNRTLFYDRAAATSYLIFEASLLFSAYHFFRMLLEKNQ